MQSAKITASVTRPADTAQYAIGDVVTDGSASRLVFSGVPGVLGSGALIESALCVDSAYHATVRPDFELWLFDTDITDLDADNAAWTPTDTQMESLVGIISFPVASFKAGDATSGAGGNCACPVNNVAVHTTANVLYGVLVLRNTYTPVSGEKFTVVLNVIR